MLVWLLNLNRDAVLLRRLLVMKLLYEALVLDARLVFDLMWEV